MPCSVSPARCAGSSFTCAGHPPRPPLRIVRMLPNFDLVQRLLTRVGPARAAVGAVLGVGR